LTWIAVEEKQDTVVVPLNAVVFRNQQPYIFVVNPDEGVVEQRPVELGITGIRQREILGGVEPGELVVEQGQNRLVDGTPVEILGDSAAQSMDNQNQQR
jgi:multidrug efflux pump subunit AcrA (membrane-fusion protein)